MQVVVYNGCKMAVVVVVVVVKGKGKGKKCIYIAPLL